MADDEISAEAPKWDRQALIAMLREGNADRQKIVERAYQVVFADEPGRIVLLHFLQECGVGRLTGSQQTAGELRYGIGMMDAAIRLANAAGYDDAALAAALLHNELIEERDHGPDEAFTPAVVVEDDDDDFR